MSAERFRYIELDRHDGVSTITINRPEVYNALHPPACDEIAQCLDAAESDPEIRAIIIGSVGGKAFSAGFDLRWAEQNPEVYDDPMVASTLVRRARGPKPLIAAVDGLAMGLGFELALACDLIVASPDARFGLPEPRVGLAAMGGGVVRLSRLLGLKQALALTLSCRQISADEGLRLGFVCEIAQQSVLDCARRWAATIAEAGPLAITATLSMAEAAAEMPLQSALDPRSHPSVMALLASEDAQEGRRAFIERRPPRWAGK